LSRAIAEINLHIDNFHTQVMSLDVIFAEFVTYVAKVPSLFVDVGNSVADFPSKFQALECGPIAT
jgi:hypothetical protein